jgi:hypothetical protein
MNLQRPRIAFRAPDSSILGRRRSGRTMGRCRCRISSAQVCAYFLRGIQRGRFLRRRLPGRKVFPHEVCNRNDRLRASAHRQEGNDACTPPGTRFLGSIRSLSGTPYLKIRLDRVRDPASEENYGRSRKLQRNLPQRSGWQGVHRVC